MVRTLISERIQVKVVFIYYTIKDTYEQTHKIFQSSFCIAMKKIDVKYNVPIKTLLVGGLEVRVPEVMMSTIVACY